MVRLAISPAALHAIAATLPSNVGVDNQRDTEGNWIIWLDLSRHEITIVLLTFRRLCSTSIR